MEQLQFDKILVEISDGLATLTLGDPDNLNALSIPMLAGFSEALHVLRTRDTPVRALLIRAEGRGFCSGLNLKDRAKVVTVPRPAVTLVQTHIFPLLRHLREAPFPTVCAINGPCAGIGVTLALMCDVAVAGRSACFVLPFTRSLAALGDGGISWLLPRVIGWARARHMLMFGKKISAADALAWGMLFDVVEDDALAESARAMALELATGPTIALAGVRRFVWEGLENSYDRQLWAEVEMNNAAHRTADYQEALSARSERRPARFTGK